MLCSQNNSLLLCFDDDRGERGSAFDINLQLHADKVHTDPLLDSHYCDAGMGRIYETTARTFRGVMYS